MVLLRAPRLLALRPQRRLFSTPVVKTFDNQSKLPRLPIPTLENLSQKYLASCKPLLSETEYQETESVVKAFTGPGGFGEVLQGRLQSYEKEQKNSWLEDIWLNKAYLEWREPSLINVNWWCQFVDHPAHPKDLLRKPPPKGVLTTFQIQRAAGLISNMLNFKELVDTERLPAEYMKDAPLDMNQYKSQFGASRLPGNPDTIRTVWPAKAKHVIVMTNDQIYKVDVMRADGSRVSLKELEKALYAVGEDSLHSTREPAVGILTAGHRDTWQKAHEELRKISDTNVDNLDIINDALFAVCLDNRSLSKNLDVSHRQIFHNNDASNRWFDKAMQLIVAPNGRAGVNGEHTPADAVIPGKIFDFILSREPAVDPANVEGTGLPAPQKIKWTINDTVKSLMAEARKTASALIEDTESCLLQTDIYGSRYIKEIAKSSPDAYVQLAMQLAWARYPNANGKPSAPTAVYESASTRLFLHGRTETGRSMTSDTWAFVSSFDNDDILYDDKRELFRKAIKSQSNYMKEATFGRGIDRHMMGLRCMIKDGEKDKATLFNDSSYLKSMWFKLSTSNMSPGRWFYGGFGPVVPDGYGINYAIDKDNLKFSISSKRSCKDTNSFTFRDSLERALKDMMILFPKRSEVWGIGWEKQRATEKKEEAYLKIMKGLSDEYVQRKDVLEKKYLSQKDGSKNAEEIKDQ
ncbi:acyltransferase ChoActase/COT/CPT [Powellomyces hirtus]|nr:acyltransferase ChoActase/COT/CPT [Powellomyces hirtus]